jgi:hypothetical protein
MLYRPFPPRSSESEFPFFFESLESRIQFSGELAGPQQVSFGDIALGDSNILDTEQQVMITNTSGNGVTVGTPTVPANSGVTVNIGGFPVNQVLLGTESATFALDISTNNNFTVNTDVTIPYNDGQNETLTIPVTGIVGSGTAPDTTPPTAKIAYAKALRVVAKYYYFAVQYTDDTAVDVNTITPDNILVSRKHYPTLHANLISVTPDADSANVTVVYAARYGPHGTWTSAFDGLWNLTLDRDQVADTSGNVAASTFFGPFDIIIPATIAAAQKAAKQQAPMIMLPVMTSLFADSTASNNDIWNNN